MIFEQIYKQSKLQESFNNSDKEYWSRWARAHIKEKWGSVEEGSISLEEEERLIEMACDTVKCYMGWEFEYELSGPY